MGLKNIADQNLGGGGLLRSSLDPPLYTYTDAALGRGKKTLIISSLQNNHNHKW